ncbi:MAG: hypothetical protein LBV33_00890, partial [Lachnospiraceae bacterium]|nr:hypothetical protein [Lachnospiraceae bacterium]
MNDHIINYLLIIAIIIIILLAVRLLILRREIAQISNNLRDLRRQGIAGKLTVSLLHRPLNLLCQEVNLGLDDLTNARIDAERREEMLRTQIANISHDLRTPLTSMIGYLQMARTNPENYPAYWEIIENRAHAMQMLVEQFYELSLLEAQD